MTRKHFILFSLSALLWVCGCVDPGYQPPQRPLAYMYPTLMSGTQLRQLKAIEVSVAELRARLELLGLWEPLEMAGLTEAELATVVRSLAHRGYAELDARRTKSQVRWVAFLGMPDGRMAIEGWNEAVPGKLVVRSWQSSEE
ncbi:MAG: hypothetical protein IKS83_05910 [Victivallales bacterium]|nr:hypothetical protein [Victivallales bacterium]